MKTFLLYFKQNITKKKVPLIQIQWNFDLTNLYIMKSLVLRMIFFSLAKITVKCMEQNLDLTNLDNKILVIANTIQKCNHNIYPDIMNKCQHVIKDESQTDQQG